MGGRRNAGLRAAGVVGLSVMLSMPAPSAAPEQASSPGEGSAEPATADELRAELRALVQRFDRVLAGMDEDIAALREQAAFGADAGLVKVLEQTEGLRSALATRRAEVVEMLEEFDGTAADGAMAKGDAAKGETGTDR
mgnify:FL=1